jgi:hypothetical protein
MSANDTTGNDGWIEGLPTEPGDYWFYDTQSGYAATVQQGQSVHSANGVLIHVTTYFLRPEQYGTPLRRVWHKPLVVPDPPVFDRTCPTCKGTKKHDFNECWDCRGKGKI